MTATSTTTTASSTSTTIATTTTLSFNFSSTTATTTPPPTPPITTATTTAMPYVGRVEMRTSCIATVTKISVHVNMESVISGLESGYFTLDQNSLIILGKCQCAGNITSASGWNEYGSSTTLKSDSGGRIGNLNRVLHNDELVRAINEFKTYGNKYM